MGGPMRLVDGITLGMLAVLVAFALGFWRGRCRRNALEHQGEAAVRRALTRQFPGSASHLLHHLTLPFGDGTTEIDHVLVAWNGIFVIETKHYSGTIVASSTAPTWTKIIGPYAYRFQHPLRQNYKHVKAIQRVLDFMPAKHMHSLVVFTGTARFRMAQPQGVFDVSGAVRHIQHYTEQVLTVQDLYLCVGRLECQRKRLSR